MYKGMFWTMAVVGSLLCGVASLPVRAAQAPVLPVERFASATVFSAPLLSPDGRHLAVGMDMGEGHHALQIFRVDDMQRTAVLRLPRYDQVHQMHWVSNERLVVAKAKRFGSLEAPWPTGEILATNADGKEQAYIYGYEQNNTAAGLDRGFGELAGVARERDGRIYMRQRQQHETRSVIYEVQTIGRPRFRIHAEINVPAMNFVLDPDGVARFAYGWNDTAEMVLHTSTDGRRWQPVPQSTVQPITVLAGGEQALAWHYDAQRRRSLARIDMAGQVLEVLATDAVFDLGGLEWQLDGRTPFLARLQGGRDAVTYLDPEAPEAVFHRNLAAQMPGKHIQVAGVREDGRTYLLYINSDRDAGGWYLYRNEEFRQIMQASDSLPETVMAPREVVRVPRGDDWIEAVITRPVGREGPLPTIVLPHGGPHGIRDDWRFDSEAQFLANRGYLVIQPNFRGSGGRGELYERSGYRQWGTGMIADIHASVEWAVDAGLADGGRVCSYGGSYGAYAALMLPIRYPGRYRCAAGLAGVYDLRLMHSRGDVQRRVSGRNYLAEALGNDMAVLQANSPAAQAQAVQVPVLLAHGSRDERVPIAHSHALRRALQAAGNPPQWMEVPNEGHGFYNDANRATFLTALETFLDQHLGSSAASSVATP